MKVKLIAPSDPNTLDPRLDPPLGILYLASVLEAEGVDVEVVDLAFHEEKDWSKAIGEADVCGVGVFTPSYYLAKKIAMIAKENNLDCVTVAGGAHATILPQETLKDFDAVIVREGEFAFRDFVKRYEATGKYEKITDGGIIEDLDSLPFPARHLIPLLNYTRKVEGKKATSIIHSRGCPYNCSYCCLAVSGHKLRFTSQAYLTKEVNQVREKWGIDHFIFYDELINPTATKMREFCSIVKPLGIRFKAAARTGIGGYEEYRMLYESGCVELAFGIESGDQRILNNIRKGTTVEKNKQSIRDAKRAGLTVKAYLMIGNPGESWETVEATINFMKEAEPDQYTLFNFIPQPGCDIYDNPEKYGIRIVDPNFKNWFYIGGQNIGGNPIATEFMTPKELAEARRYMLKKLGKPKVSSQDYYKKLEGKVYE